MRGVGREVKQYPRIGAGSSCLPSGKQRPLGKRGITADTAVRLAKFFFGTSAQFGLGLQAAYEVSVFKAENRGVLAQIKPLKALHAHAL